MKFAILILALSFSPFMTHAQADLGGSQVWMACPDPRPTTTAQPLLMTPDQTEIIQWVRENAIDVPAQTASKITYIGPNSEKLEFIRYRAMVGFNPSTTLAELKALLTQNNLSVVRYNPIDIQGESTPYSACNMFLRFGVLFLHKTDDDGKDNIFLSTDERASLISYFSPEWIQNLRGEKIVTAVFIDAPILQVEIDPIHKQ